MNSKKVKEIVKFSIQKNLQSKWFILLNALILITMIITTNASNITTFLENNNINLFNDEINIEIIDNENIAKDKLFEIFEEDENISLSEIEVNEYTKENIPDNVIVIEINKSDEYFVSSIITSKEGINGSIYSKIEEVMIETRSELFAKSFNIEEEDLSLLNTEPNIERIMLGVDAENSDTKELIKTVSTVLVYAVSIFIFSKIANEIAQEKVSKSIEYVLTSVTEKEYLLAKIISIISLVLLQGLYFFIYYIIGNLINNIININVIQQVETNNILELLQGIDKDIILYVLTVFVYAILTLILMSIIQAALSSKTTNMSEAGNTMTFLMSITIAMYMLTLFLITPYTNMTPIIYIISCIPLVSNYFIPAIMIIGQATPLQIIVSLALLIVSIPITFNKCSKIFKNGVLDYRPNPKFKGKKKERTLKEEQEHSLMVMKFRKYAFAIGMAIILWLAIQVIGQYLISVLVAPFLANVFDSAQLELLILTLTSILSIIVPIGFLSIYTDKTSKNEKKRVNIKDSMSIIFIGIFLIGIIQIFVAYLYKLLGIDYSILEVLSVDTATSSVLTNVLFIIAIAVTPAIFEELLFRKAIMNYSQKIGSGFAIIISAIVFGLIHMNVGQAIFAFLLGIVFGIIYNKTKNIMYTIILHFLNNGYAVLLQIFMNNESVTSIINVFVIASMVLGFALLVMQIYKNREKIKNFKFDKSKFNIGNYKYIFTDYTFIVAMILVIVCFSLTENMLIGM